MSILISPAACRSGWMQMELVAARLCPTARRFGHVDRSLILPRCANSTAAAVMAGLNASLAAVTVSRAIRLVLPNLNLMGTLLPELERVEHLQHLDLARNTLTDQDRRVCEASSALASADLLRREEEFYSSLFDSAKGDGVRSRSQLIERKIEVLEDMATKGAFRLMIYSFIILLRCCTQVSNRRSRRWLNDRLLIELVPRLHVEEIKGLFAPPPWGEELPLSAFCRTSAGEWDAFRSIDMDAESRLMQHMKRSSEKHRTQVDQDELVALNAWHRIDRQTREAMKRNFLPDLLEIYEVPRICSGVSCLHCTVRFSCLQERVRAFIDDASDKDVLVLNVQDPFQRLLLHGVCEFYNVTSTTSSSVRDGKPWKTTTIKKRQGTGVPSKITLVGYLRMKKNGTQ
ncbi:hypothetical protein HU200_054405 [Digitaria exilis]|uniref:R3H-associated N-terminal domain-containing protein n=1 Tax=Digitaria exilis TaxID=1010633 RepID=A0A835E7K6_9POAL|nr:hypothetical protein HU200_054405 [Digitaria exilis]